MDWRDYKTVNLELSYLLLGVLTYKWKHIFQSSFGWVIPSILWGFSVYRDNVTILFSVVYFIKEKKEIL